MRNKLVILLIVVILVSAGAACKKTDNDVSPILGDSDKESSSDVINPGTAYPNTKGLHNTELPVGLADLSKLVLQKYSDATFTNIRLSIKAEEYIWAIDIIHKSDLVQMEINAETGETIWESTYPLDESQESIYRKMSFTLDKIADLQTAIQLGQSVLGGSIHSVYIEKLDINRVYIISSETSAGVKELRINAEDGSIIL